METGCKISLEDSVESIGAIVDFEEDENESDPETNALVNSINNIINLSIDPEALSKAKTDTENIDLKDRNENEYYNIVEKNEN